MENAKGPAAKEPAMPMSGFHSFFRLMPKGGDEKRPDSHKPTGFAYQPNGPFSVMHAPQAPAAIRGPVGRGENNEGRAVPGGARGAPDDRPRNEFWNDGANDHAAGGHDNDGNNRGDDKPAGRALAEKLASSRPGAGSLKGGGGGGGPSSRAVDLVDPRAVIQQPFLHMSGAVAAAGSNGGQQVAWIPVYNPGYVAGDGNGNGQPMIVYTPVTQDKYGSWVPMQGMTLPGGERMGSPFAGTGGGMLRAGTTFSAGLQVPVFVGGMGGGGSSGGNSGGKGQGGSRRDGSSDENNGRHLDGHNLNSHAGTAPFQFVAMGGGNKANRGSNQHNNGSGNNNHNSDNNDNNINNGGGNLLINSGSRGNHGGVLSGGAGDGGPSGGACGSIGREAEQLLQEQRNLRAVPRMAQALGGGPPSPTSTDVDREESGGGSSRGVVPRGAGTGHLPGSYGGGVPVGGSQYGRMFPMGVAGRSGVPSGSGGAMLDRACSGYPAGGRPLQDGPSNRYGGQRPDSPDQGGNAATQCGSARMQGHATAHLMQQSQREQQPQRYQPAQSGPPSSGRGRGSMDFELANSPVEYGGGGGGSGGSKDAFKHPLLAIMQSAPPLPPDLFPGAPRGSSAGGGGGSSGTEERLRKRSADEAGGVNDGGGYGMGGGRALPKRGSFQDDPRGNGGGMASQRHYSGLADRSGGSARGGVEDEEDGVGPRSGDMHCRGGGGIDCRGGESSDEDEDEDEGECGGGGGDRCQQAPPDTELRLDPPLSSHSGDKSNGSKGSRGTSGISGGRSKAGDGGQGPSAPMQGRGSMDLQRICS
eukprot:jgi/Mesvir1/26782/Mv20551-RA.1